MPLEPTVELLEPHVAKSEADDGAGFHVCDETGLQKWRSIRPLMVIVHPGDAVEHPFGWSTKHDMNGAISMALSRQAGMAGEIEARLGAFDVFVLHRQSSREFFDPAHYVDSEYRRSVLLAGAGPRSVMAYGDDLDAALEWLDDNAMVEDRPAVFFTGAYADACYGCITYIGRGLRRLAPHVSFAVSPFSPTDSSDVAPRWDPSEQIPRPRFAP